MMGMNEQYLNSWSTFKYKEGRDKRNSSSGMRIKSFLYFCTVYLPQANQNNETIQVNVLEK